MKKNNIIISLASNYQQEENLTEARRRLSQVLSDSAYTEELWTIPYSVHGQVCSQSDTPRYLNQLLYAQTALTAPELIKLLKEIELSMGRTAEKNKQGIVAIDLDLMLYNEDRYHLSDWQRPYMLQLLEMEVK